MTLVHNMRSGEQRYGLINLCNFSKNILGDSNLKIIEIGSYCGASTEIIASIFQNSKIYSVDPWESYVEDCSSYDLGQQALELKEAETIFDNMITKYSNIIKNKYSSVQFSNKCEDNSIDMIYIDGNHQYSSVLEDLKIWYPKIKNGGIISGHDGSWSSVNRALLEFFKVPPVANFQDSSWAYIKNG